MPVFEYKAYRADGRSDKGMVDAENAKAARMKLRKTGLSVYEIYEKNASGGSVTRAGAKGRAAPSQGFSFGSPVNGQDISLMTRQLASLIRSNIPLVEALSAMVEQTEHKHLKGVLAQIRQDVNEGISLAKALLKHPRIFDAIFTNMIEAGEASGTLGLVLIRLADLKEAQMRLRSKIIAGMTYPTLMLGASVAILLGLFTFVIPQLATVFEGMNKEMPPLTVAIMALSNFLVNYWYIVFAVVGGALFLFFSYIKTASGRSNWDAFLLQAPLVGPLLQMIGVTRFASTMSTLLGTGVPILTAMNISKNLVGNVHIAEAITQARENITEGQSIAEPLRRSGQFPPLVIHMISIGEKTGELPDMLDNVARTYEEQVSTKIQKLTSLIEPIMIIGMGIMISFVVMSVFVPLLDLSDISNR